MRNAGYGSFGLQAEVLFFRAFGSEHGGLETTATTGPYGCGDATLIGADASTRLPLLKT